ncbi:hypothetical protein C0Q70_01688 [Pomacea canaliculata]|uniref:Uncharacterized protein n=1 Tax=Pomacea canaliculata TaxID=400727 RepID=A0A2T7Q081_POMCA|nr:hypothetical protein C0Q70_01688 [Pomacea canaliculata]
MYGLSLELNSFNSKDFFVMTFCQQLRRGGDVLEGDRCRSGIDFISSRPIQHITTEGHNNPRKDLSSVKCPDRLPQHSSPCSCSFRRFSHKVLSCVWKRLSHPCIPHSPPLPTLHPSLFPNSLQVGIGTTYVSIDLELSALGTA